MTRGRWPLVLTSNDIILRPLRLRDRNQWDEVRAINRDWLSPWEATRPLVPGEDSETDLPSYFQMVTSHNREGRAERSLTLSIWYKGSMVGQITLGGVVMGALRGAHIGYWIDHRFSNLGIMTQSVVMLTEYGFQDLDLHRIEINLRPENTASRRVAEKAGYHLEGERPRFLHIDGQWRDHLSFVSENPKII